MFVVMRAIFENHKPAGTGIDWQFKVQGNQVFAYGIDPTTGELQTMEETLGQEIPAGFKFEKVLDNGQMLLLPETGVITGPEDILLFGETGEFAKPGEDLEGKSVAKLIDDYPDAGIDFTDSLEEARQKIINNSALYRKKTTHAAPVSVTWPKLAQDAIFDKTGQQVGFSIYNPITGTREYKDFKGNIIPFPEAGSVGKAPEAAKFGTDAEMRQVERWLRKQPGFTEADLERARVDINAFNWALEESEYDF